MKEKKHRNMAICHLIRFADWSFYALGVLFGMDKRNVRRVWKRDKEKYKEKFKKRSKKNGELIGNSNN